MLGTGTGYQPHLELTSQTSSSHSYLEVGPTKMAVEGCAECVITGMCRVLPESERRLRLPGAGEEKLGREPEQERTAALVLGRNPCPGRLMADTSWVSLEGLPQPALCSHTVSSVPQGPGVLFFSCDSCWAKAPPMGLFNLHFPLKGASLSTVMLWAGAATCASGRARLSWCQAPGVPGSS